MLKALLRQAFAGQPAGTDEPTGAVLTRDMYTALERFGYIVELRPGGNDAAPCQRCAQQRACLPQDCIRLWALTPKGRRLLGK